MPTGLRKAGKFFLDATLLSSAFLFAFAVRYDFALDWPAIKQMLLVLPYIVLFKFIVLLAFGTHLFMWRYTSLKEIVRIGGALGAASAILIFGQLLARHYADKLLLVHYAVIPLSVLLLDFMFAFLTLIGIRTLHRMFVSYHESQERGKNTTPQTRTVLIGAGRAGIRVAEGLEKNPQFGIQPVLFLDDDAGKIGHVVHGLKIAGTTEQLPAIAEQHKIQQVLITLPEADSVKIRRIVELCDGVGVPVKIIPDLGELVIANDSLNKIRSVEIEDLLGRDPVVLDSGAISENLRDKVVVVTGAGGSIGSELCRQVARFNPQRLLLIEQFENALFNIHGELLREKSGLNLVPLIADITDKERIEDIFKEFRPSIVFHAAAHKHVPMMEMNPGEAVKNNIGGTRVVADASHTYGVRQFVMVSTDKAVNPTSIMGATKRAAEIYVQSYCEKSKTHFITVRFGNVLGSSGSVVPIFQKQIAKGGPVTVTHPEMTRYFMTIPEATQLILQAASMGSGGEVFILDMGKPMKIVDLAKDMIRLAGLRLGVDIQIEFTGIRPGEKLFEELSVASESAEKTRHPKIFIGKIRPQVRDRACSEIEKLCSCASYGGDVIRQELRRIIPEYREPQRLENSTEVIVSSNPTSAQAFPSAPDNVRPSTAGGSA